MSARRRPAATSAPARTTMQSNFSAAVGERRGRPQHLQITLMRKDPLMTPDSDQPAEPSNLRELVYRRHEGDSDDLNDAARGWRP
jgi:hypothetical protein